MRIIRQLQHVADEAGSYLLEVLVALFLFSLAMMGLAQLGYASMMGNKNSQQMMEATVLCQDRLEQAKDLGYERVDSLNNINEEYNTISGYPGFRRITSVSPISGIDAKQVQVRVFWSNGGHSFTLQTAISQR